MTIIDLLTGPWAILPDKLAEIQAVYATHLRGEKIDIAAIEARIGRPLASEQQAYQMRDGGVAHLAFEGTIAPKANLFTQISGGVSAQMALKQVQSMHADPRVRSALLEIDSGGGSVFGVPAVAEAIRAMAADKPVAALSTGMMASAAYWWGSAANAVFISGLTDHVGSIGVVATHNYRPSRSGAQAGETTEITAGRYKRIASDNAPLTAEGRAYLQAHVDEIYRVFVDAVATHRRVSAEQVLQHMADGRVMIGQQAIDAGLVDGVSSVDALAEELATHPARFAQRRQAVFAMGALGGQPQADASAASADATGPLQPAIRAVLAPFQANASADNPIHGAGSGVARPEIAAGSAPTAQTDEPVPPVTSQPLTSQGDPTMDRQTLERDHPALFADLRSEFMAAGAAAEIERVKAVRAAALPGHEALIEQLAADGQTTGAQAAQAVLAAHRERLTGAAAGHFADAPKPAPTSAAPVDERTDGDPVAAATAPRKLSLYERAYGALNNRKAVTA